ncbi:MAG TPA: TIGR03621 family F420-dependent LLM class oxidoreductase [Chloroflexota bacterium]|nr:TIGR03621 family F420-dependent LLM class oxidoreductase [Chloroflexota bacterium]
MAAQRPFRFGIVGPTVSAEGWAPFARKAEALGYSTLVRGEHVSMGSAGPIAALMAAAAATTSLRVGSHVFANDLRHPALLAQEAATIDVLSGGRLELGIDSGWLGLDYEALGLPLDPPGVRVSRLSEAVSLIKQLFGEEAVTHRGSFYDVRNLNLIPKPLQRPHPPLLIGGGGRRILSLAAREADIVSLDIQGTAEGAKDVATMMDEAVAQKIAWVRQAAGERFGALELHVLVQNVVVTADRLQEAQQMAEALASRPSTVLSNAAGWSREAILTSPHALIGTIEQIVEDLQERRECYGISYLTVYAGALDAFSPVVARLAGT